MTCNVKTIKKRSDNNSDKEPKQITFRTIRGFKFKEFVVSMATRLRARVKACGVRSIRTILEIINESFHGELFEDIPSRQTIEDWCEKAGLDVYTGAKDLFKDEEYVSIGDESISVGKQKLFVELAVPAKHPGRPLRQSDVSVVSMAISPSWNTEAMKRQLDKTHKSIGPEYSVTDNGYNLCGACRELGIAHHRDISHTFGVILKKHFGKCTDFKELTAIMEKNRLKYQLTDKAIFLPPKQRSIARFMNCSLWVGWAKNMCGKYETLTQEGKEACKFVKEYETLITELDAVIKCMSYVEERCKQDGLSKDLANFLEWYIVRTLVTADGATYRMIMAGIDMYEYLRDECKVLKTENDVHIISSDVIESCFGAFKSTKSPDKLCGITKHVLVLPLTMMFTSREKRLKFDFKTAMENVHYRDLKEWKDLNLYGNPAMERRELLRKAE